MNGTAEDARTASATLKSGVDCSSNHACLPAWTSVTDTLNRRPVNSVSCENVTLRPPLPPKAETSMARVLSSRASPLNHPKFFWSLCRLPTAYIRGVAHCLHHPCEAGRGAMRSYVGAVHEGFERVLQKRLHDTPRRRPGREQRGHHRPGGSARKGVEPSRLEQAVRLQRCRRAAVRNALDAAALEDEGPIRSRGAVRGPAGDGDGGRIKRV
mmetsp:Transcript_8441/g.29662  ORF Transcript_8441/g.29662 Transcript_8441/m.29662 type:complete len:212 (-) Transcript_8441:380-1015(-)